MTIFEISGTEVTGGKNDSENQTCLKRMKSLEGFIQSIGKTIGMASLDSAFVKSGNDGYGFRFAQTSDEKFDARAIQTGNCENTSELVEKLG